MKNLTNTMLLWDRESGEVMLCPWPQPRGAGFDRLPSSWGACDFDISEMSHEDRKTALFIQFAHLVVRDGIDPHQLNRVLLDLEEWRDGCSCDMPGAAQAMIKHGEDVPGPFG